MYIVYDVKPEITVGADWEYENISDISLTLKFGMVGTSIMLAPGRLRRRSMTSNHQQLVVTVRIYNHIGDIVRLSFHISQYGEFTPENRILKSGIMCNYNS